MKLGLLTLFLGLMSLFVVTGCTASADANLFPEGLPPALGYPTLAALDAAIAKHGLPRRVGSFFVDSNKVDELTGEHHPMVTTPSIDAAMLGWTCRPRKGLTDSVIINYL